MMMTRRTLAIAMALSLAAVTSGRHVRAPSSELTHLAGRELAHFAHILTHEP